MRFTIRDLLWLTVVVALAVAWWVDRSNLAGRAERADVLEAVLDSAELKVDYAKRGNRISHIRVSKPD